MWVVLATETEHNVNTHKPLHTEKVITENGKGLRLVSNKKLSLNKCSSAIAVQFGLKKRKIRTWFIFKE